MKKILICCAVILSVIILVFAVRWFLCGWIDPVQVERIELSGEYSCETPPPKTAELSKAEIDKIVNCYNFSTTYVGTPNADSCDTAFGLVVYFKDGTCMKIYDADVRSYIQVYPVHGDSFWVRNDQLAEYALELIDQHDLHQS